MKKGSILILLVFVLIKLHALYQKSDPEVLPNILFVAVDDLKPLMNCYGDSTMHTPNFDRLAERGVIFTNAHVQQAVCGPSRASVMTATYPDRTRVWDLHTDFRNSAPDLISMPEYLIRLGYHTEALGKIYHYNSASPNHDGRSWSTEHFVKPDNYQPVYGTPPFAYWMNPDIRPIRDSLFFKAENEGIFDEDDKMAFAMKNYRPSTECLDANDHIYPDGLITDEAVKRLQKLALSEQPFFLATGFIKPHLPFNAPKKYWDLYDRQKIDLAEFRTLGKDVPKIEYHTLWEIGAYSDIDGSLPLGTELPEAKQLELIHGYKACVSYIDAQLGKLLDALEKHNLSENTLIVLWGDHGYHLGDHTQWCKHTNLENATRIPLIFAGPGIEKGLVVDHPVELVDVFPTLFDLANIPIPKQVQGKTLVPLVKNERKDNLQQDFAVSQFHRGKNIMGYSLKTANHRYTEWRKFEKPFRESGIIQPYSIIGKELYDYSSDPLESINLIGDRNYKEIESKLKQKLETHILGVNQIRPNKKKVFLFAGQSNMDGRADGALLSEKDKERLTKSGKQVEYHLNHKPPSPLQVTLAQPWHQKKFDLEYSFGPELFFGIELAEKFPDGEFIFIKRALGGASLYGCWNPEWNESKARLMNEENRPRLYKELIDYTNSILTNIDTSEYELAAVFWVQGETDSNTKKFGHEPAKQYAYNLKKLISAIRLDLDEPNLPFIMLQVGHGKVVEGMQQVTKELKNVYIIPNSKDLISPFYFEKNPPPNGHYNHIGMKKIGTQFFNVYTDHYAK